MIAARPRGRMTPTVQNGGIAAAGTAQRGPFLIDGRPLHGHAARE
jgi:hypothetical protein